MPDIEELLAEATREAVRAEVPLARRWLGRMVPRARARVVGGRWGVKPTAPVGPELLDDIADIELATGVQVEGVEPEAVGTAIADRRPCSRCGRPTVDLPTIPSRSPEYEFTRCPRCHRSTLHPVRSPA